VDEANTPQFSKKQMMDANGLKKSHVNLAEVARDIQKYRSRNRGNSDQDAALLDRKGS
jgi:hypothetical protein